MKYGLIILILTLSWGYSQCDWKNFVSLGMIHIAGFDIFEIIGDNFNKQE